jgi:hypothetical protein
VLKGLQNGGSWDNLLVLFAGKKAMLTVYLQEICDE